MAPKGGNTLEELSERQVLLFTAHDLTNRAGSYTLIDVCRAEAQHGSQKLIDQTRMIASNIDMLFCPSRCSSLSPSRT
jgi:hypothetical protein